MSAAETPLPPSRKRVRKSRARSAIARTAKPMDGSMVNFLASAMADPTIDANKLDVLVRLQREIVADEERRAAEQARRDYVAAMFQAQAEMVPIVRNAPNEQTNSKYAKLETIDGLIRPIYTRHGFVLTFNSVPLDGAGHRVVCNLLHQPSGHVETFALEASPDTTGLKGSANKTELHGLGSMVTYLRRYLTCMAFNVILINEDFDGNRRQAVDDGRMSEAMLAEIDRLMIATRSSEGKLLATLNLNHRSIAQVPASEFERLRNSLLNKARLLSERAAITYSNGDAR